MESDIGKEKTISMPRKKVRLGIVGLGNVGSAHAVNLLAGKVERAELVAVCDGEEGRLKPYARLKTFSSSAALFRSGAIDAVYIATPHYHHTTVGIEALRAGLHVLVEKPLSVHVADGQRMLAAHRDKRQVFAIMFQMRTTAMWRKIKQLVSGGELGEIRRINWIVTDWFRTEAYYASGGWRATWAGEGGGVLLNQCPHNLDLLQWLFGMPQRVRGYCRTGRYHRIEVEDDVTAYLEYPNGATAVFITSTGEWPGTNRLEVTGERGRLVLENGSLQYKRNAVPMSVFSRMTPATTPGPSVLDVQIPIKEDGETPAVVILRNFVDAILDGAPLFVPAAEGLKSVELANAMLLSSFQDRSVDLPLSARAYERLLKQLIARSRRSKLISAKALRRRSTARSRS